MNEMSEILQANIFFFITGVAVIIFTLLLCVALFHIIKVLKSLRRIMDRIDEGTEIIAEDMQNVRAYFTEGGFFSRLLGSLMGRGESSKRRSARQEKKRTELKIKDEV